MRRMVGESEDAPAEGAGCCCGDTEALRGTAAAELVRRARGLGFGDVAARRLDGCWPVEEVVAPVGVSQNI